MRLQRRIPCPECLFELTVGSMTAHHHCMHGTVPVIDWGRLPVIQTVHQPHVYNVSSPRTTKRCPCPFPGYPGSSTTCNGLQFHFNMQHWGYRIMILEEHPNPLPRRDQCGIQVPSGRLNNCHYASEKCKQGDEWRLRCETLQR